MTEPSASVESKVAYCIRVAHEAPGELGNTELQFMADTITRLQAALVPFAAMGRLMDSRATITFGKVVPDSEIVCSSSGEVGLGVLCMGHFRDALALCPNAPGWGGMYRPPFDRSSVGGE